MKRTLVRYKTKPETREQNRRLIENVFAELRAKSPDGVRYMVLMLEDDSFLHFVESRDPDNSVPKLDAFKLFQGGIRDRCAEPPHASEATIVGNYRMLDER